MKARIIISIVFLLVSGSVFSQTKKETYTWAGIDYQIINGIYTNFKIDRDFLLDFFTKDYPVFSLQNYYEDGKRSHNYWFSTTKYSKLVRFDVSEIMGKLLRVETDSKYKEQFYKK